ncbi:MAG: 2-amino-4-hydroxy-6-hydroxymethyldihydropteridine diphosphokinase [Paludibacteraceae bacterium]|nr:2-amino-4-hydroxy-6-hydroxymethyldihydropteridine diphosphokinase [Paludibacteraceae bacterium]
MTLNANVQTNNKVYLSLGTNIGDRHANIDKALSLIRERVGYIEAVSSIIETEPIGFLSPNKFLNCAICVITALSPSDLLYTTQDIERSMGRTTKSVNGVYSDRIIDIDILLYNDIKISTHELKIPHPHMQEREFVIKPLSEIRN